MREELDGVHSGLWKKISEADVYSSQGCKDMGVLPGKLGLYAGMGVTDTF